MNESGFRRAIRRLGLPPRSLRWRLQIWQGFLVVSMMAGFGATIYRLQSVNRFRQIDADLETRVTALSRSVREVYRDGPPDEARSGKGAGGNAQQPGPPPPDKKPVQSAAQRGGPVEEPLTRKVDRKLEQTTGGRNAEGEFNPGRGHDSSADGRALRQAPPEPETHAARPPGPPPTDDGPGFGRGPDGPGRGPGFEPPPDDPGRGRESGPGRGPGFGPPPDDPGRDPGPGGPDRGPRSESRRAYGPPGDDRGFRPPPLHGRGEPPRSSPNLTEVPLSTETLRLFGEPVGFYFVIWSRDGSVLNRSANAPSNSPPPSRSERDTLPHYRTRGDYREALHCSGMGDCAMAGRSVKEDLAATYTFGWTLTGAGVITLVLGFGLGWLFIGRAIRPIGYIGNTATRIASGNLSERIDVGDLDDELGRLAAVLNSTFARLEAAFARQQEFTSNAAHELRTPLSVLISEAQTTLARPRTADEYRETVEGGLETAQQMRKITETLLDLARFDAADPAVSRAHIDLAEIAAACVDRLKPLADKDGIPIRRNLASVHALVAPDRIHVVVSNLLSNALYYNRPGGEIEVTTSCEDGKAVLKVADTGIGIGGDDIARIFDRFYRADKARSQSHGHSGLGLAICKTIIEAENGEITVTSTLGEGTTFTISFVSTAANRRLPA